MKVPKFFVRNFKIIAMTKMCITFYQVMSLLITPYSLDWKENHFMLATLKLVRRLQFFYHVLSGLVTPYHTLSPWLERKPFYVGNFKISSQPPDFLYLITPCHSLLITPYHTLSPWLKRKPFYVGNFKISSPVSDFVSHLITPCHSLSHLIP